MTERKPQDRARKNVYQARYRERHREQVRAYNTAYVRARRSAQPGYQQIKGTRLCKQCQTRRPHADFPTPSGRLCHACSAARVGLSPEERAARHMACVARWKAANAEKVKADTRAYYAANRDRINARRRARTAAKKALPSLAGRRAP